MTRADTIREVAELHAATLDQGFLATMGRDFLALMYRAIDEGGDSFLLVQERDGRVVGFVSGGQAMSRVYRRMLRHPFVLARAMLPVVSRPGRMLKVLEILFYSARMERRGDLPQWELWSIGVAQPWRGAGIAEQLFRQLVEKFRHAGARRFRIVVGEGLDAAHRFYRRMGAVPVMRTQVHRNQGSLVYACEVGNGVN